jgi:hypothetical protein
VETRYARAAQIFGFINARWLLGASVLDGLLASGMTLTDEQAAACATSS